MFNRRTALEPTTKLSYEALHPPLRQTAVSGWAYLSFVSNISCLVELADILHFHNCTKRNSRLAVVFKRDRKSTGLNSSHVRISYAVFCLKKKNIIINL